MKEKFKNIDWNILRHGDKVIWAMVILLLVFSLLGVISTSTIREVKSISGVFIDFARDVAAGIVFMYLAYLASYKLYRGLSIVLFWVSIGLLLVAFSSGTVIAGQSAGRWIRVFGFSFQPSAIALIAMVLYVSRFIEKYHKGKKSMMSMSEALIKLWVPVVFMFILIAVHNLSTGLIFLATFYTVLIIGLYSWRHIVISLIIFAAGGLSLYGGYKAFPDKFEKTRIPTWVSRVETFFKTDKTPVKEMTQDDMDKIRQVTASKTAVALGVAEPAGPGKSKQKYFLSQADSDFIYAIIVEENGLFGGLLILLCFITIVIRVMMQVFRSLDMFSVLTLSGLLCVMMCQAIVHMGVVVGMIPVTGQNLPFISSGGTSIIASLLTIGIMQKLISNRQSITAAQNAAKENPTEHPQEEKEETMTEYTEQEEENYAHEVLEEIQNK